ncbi:MFS transporter [Saccharopolyspora kobensis]|uniref:MFS transporter n=1 Tax=Saccharopolyspora kobensis TaxID=146035 RepID=UPI0021667962|nr:MFS transporter [Saccharopolyspora kobensis]
MQSDATTTGDRGEAGRRAGLAFLLLPTLLLAVDLGVLWMAVPQLSADLGPTSTELLWINDSYGFAMACLLVLGGNIGDRFGRRRLLMIGLAVFTAASVLAACAWSPAVLIAARVLLGTSSAAIIPSTPALISGMFRDTRRRARAIALWVTTLSTGIALGPVLSGVLLAHFWWGSVFLVGVPVLVVALIGVPATVPELADPDVTPLDRLSVPLLLMTLLPLVYAIKHFGEHGLDAPLLVAVAAAVVFGALFVRRQRSIDNPLLDLDLFRDRAFVAAPLLLFTGLAAMNGVEYLMPQYLQLVGGVASLEAGLLMVLPAVGLALGSQLTPLLARRAGPARVIAAGAAVAIAGFALIATAPGVATVTAGTTVMMLGLAPITVLGTNIAVSAAAPEKAGQASAIGQTSYELGLAFGIAATGSLVSAVYRDHVRTYAPEGVPSDVVAEVAGNLGGGAAVPALADVARAGFTSGLQAAAIVSGCLAVLLAVFALVLLERSRTEQREAEPVG